MLIELSPTELKHLQIEYLAKKEFRNDYLEQRERVWADELEKVKARNGNMWNGEVYTLENIIHGGDENVVLQMSSCEFKDVIFKVVKGSAYVTRQYGLSHLPRLVGVICVPVTMDGKFVAGIRADQTFNGMAPVGAIGGSLSKDEMEVHNFSDIQAFMGKELQEETAIEFPSSDLKLFRLVFQKSIYHFCFTFKLPITSDQIDRCMKPGEFSCLVAMTQKELLESQRSINPLRYLLPFLHNLSSVNE